MRLSIAGSLLVIFLLLAAAGAGALVALLQSVQVDLARLDEPLLHSATIVYDDAGDEWLRFWRDRREPLAYTALPAVVIQAFVAAEDHDFFQHHGFSWRGIVRSIIVNSIRRRIVYGGSTITQQLVKLVFTSSERTFRRKIKEQLLALDLERRYTKEQIMQAYLNNVYFGHGIYGVAAAVGRFWQIDLAQLTVAQAATLAAIVKSPARFCPLTDIRAVLRRRNYVISMMQTLGMIDATTAEQAMQEELVVAPAASAIAPHAQEYIRQWLERRFGNALLYGSGLRVYTTINRALQTTALQITAQGVATLRKQLHLPVDIGLLMLDAQTGGIKALVGGASFTESQYNRALAAKRQLGSIIKPLVYAAAVAQGHRMDEVAIDEPLTIQIGSQQWMPRNHDRQFHGPMTLARALSLSTNSITIKTLLNAGYDAVLSMGAAAGLPMPQQGYPSLALGCIDVTVLQAAGMMNAIVHDGMYREPFCIQVVNDAWGTRLYTAQTMRRFVVTAAVAAQIRQVLMLGVKRYASIIPGATVTVPACGKTGTTNDSRTCWFAGATPHYTTALYVGTDNNVSMGANVFPSTTAFPLWLQLINAVGDEGQFTTPDNLTTITIDWTTGAIDPAGVPILVPKN